MRCRISACDALVLHDQQEQAINRVLAAGESQGRPVWLARALSRLTLLQYRLGRLAEARAASGRLDDTQAALRALQAELPAMSQPGALAWRGEFSLAAWRVLHQAGDAQAPAQLALAEAELQHVLDGFQDAAGRQRVAQTIPWHRDVLEALAAQQPVGGVHSMGTVDPAAPSS